jgi:hypothetical protein
MEELVRAQIFCSSAKQRPTANLTLHIYRIQDLFAFARYPSSAVMELSLVVYCHPFLYRDFT